MVVMKIFFFSKLFDALISGQVLVNSGPLVRLRVDSLQYATSYTIHISGLSEQNLLKQYTLSNHNEITPSHTVALSINHP